MGLTGHGIRLCGTLWCKGEKCLKLHLLKRESCLSFPRIGVEKRESYLEKHLRHLKGEKLTFKDAMEEARDLGFKETIPNVHRLNYPGGCYFVNLDRKVGGRKDYDELHIPFDTIPNFISLIRREILGQSLEKHELAKLVLEEEKIREDKLDNLNRKASSYSSLFEISNLKKVGVGTYEVPGKFRIQMKEWAFTVLKPDGVNYIPMIARVPLNKESLQYLKNVSENKVTLDLALLMGLKNSPK